MFIIRNIKISVNTDKRNWEIETSHNEKFSNTINSIMKNIIKKYFNKQIINGIFLLKSLEKKRKIRNVISTNFYILTIYRIITNHYKSISRNIIYYSNIAIFHIES